MAHEGKSIPSVKAAMIETWKAHLGAYLDDINTKYGWHLPMPTKYHRRAIVAEQYGNSPMVGVYVDADTPVGGCAGTRLKKDTRFVMELMLTRELVNESDDAITFVDAFEEYQEALLMALFKDQYGTDTAFLSAAGVEYIRGHFTAFDPLNAGADPSTSPVIRISRSWVVFRRHHKSY